MTTTLEWWQIAVLTLAILSLVVILRRTVTLIALVRTQSWYGLSGNRTSVSAQNHPKTGSSESLRGTAVDINYLGPDGVRFTPRQDWDETCEGATGFSPSGVGYYVPAVPAKAGVAKRFVPKRRGR